MNILFITDNLQLSRQILKFLRSKFELLNYDFSISPFSDHALFSEKLAINVEVFNLKNEQHIKKIVEKYDLVFSIHCKQLFPAELVKSAKCINLHPGYNPINRGWYPQVFAIINGTDCGATLHEIDEELDHGKIIDRRIVKPEAHDTSLSLYNKIQKVELMLFKKNFAKILQNKYRAFLPEDEGNVFYLKDFKKLKEIDLEETVRAGDFIDRLRAMSHGGFRNAYFYDPIKKKRVFLKLELFSEE